MACICYKMSTGHQSHPITWVTVGTYPRTEAGFYQALRHEGRILESDYATRIIKTRDNDCRRVWLVQQCSPWRCCQMDNA